MKRTISLILSLLMVFSLFTLIPVGAAEKHFAGCDEQKDIVSTGKTVLYYLDAWNKYHQLVFLDDDDGTLEYEGNAGPFIQWEYKNCTVTLTGEGPLQDMDWFNKPFVVANHSVENLVYYDYFEISKFVRILKIGEGITEIPDNGFYITEYIIGTSSNYYVAGGPAEKLYDLSLPSTLKIIGSEAFCRAENLRSVTIPDNVEHIGDRAFLQTPMDSITLPKGIKSIGERAFGYNPDKIAGFIVRGYSGTAAETYAEENGFIFEPLDKCRINFDANGGSGDMDYVDISAGNSYTLPENEFSAPSGRFFDGWEVDGKQYQPGDKIKVDGSITVKALWRNPINCTVSFKSSASSGTSDSVTVKEGTEYTVPECTFTHPYKYFLCWSCNGKNYNPGDTVIVNGNMTFTAQWIDKAAYHIYFDSNGSYNVMSWDYGYEGDTYTVPKCTLTPPAQKKFGYWSGSNGKDYHPGDKIVLSEDITMKAIWVEADRYTVWYDCNGGSGYMDDDYVYDGDIYVVPKCTFTAPEGKEFRCWSAGGENYAPGDYVYSIKKNTTFKALWKDKAAEYEYRANSDGTVTFYRYRGADSELFVPKEYNGADVTIFGSGSNYAVNGLNTLESIVIPEGVTTVNHNAVQSCENLAAVTIPNSVTEIGRNAFKDNASLSRVKMSSGVKKIGYDAFMNCPSLKEITLPAGLTEIGDHAFGFVENPDYDGENGERYNKVAGFTIRGAKGSAAQAYAIENGFIFIVTETPSVVIEEKTDKVTGVKVTADSTLVLDVQSVGKGGIVITSDGEITAAYDITLKKDGKAVQPEGSVTVKIPCSDPNAKVYRVEADGSITDMHATYQDGYLVFKTDHFSLYVVTASDQGAILGDADGDGNVTIYDASAIQRHIAGMKPSPFDTAAADVDGDGNVTIYDASAIQRYIAGMTGVPAGIGKSLSS